MRYLILAVLTMWFASATADDRIDRIAQAMNSQDPIAAQADFSRTMEAARRSAELGRAAEVGNSFTVKQSKRVFPQTYGAKVVDTAGNEYIWVLVECDNEPGKWCYWDTRPVKFMGGADRGQFADVATTAIGLASGLAEGNPAGLGFVLPYKAIHLIASRHVTFEQCMGMRPGWEGAGYGASAMNLMTLIGAPTGIGIAAFVATLFYTWDGAVENALFDCTGYELSR